MEMATALYRLDCMRCKYFKKKLLWKVGDEPGFYSQSGDKYGNNRHNKTMTDPSESEGTFY